MAKDTSTTTVDIRKASIACLQNHHAQLRPAPQLRSQPQIPVSRRRRPLCRSLPLLLLTSLAAWAAAAGDPADTHPGLNLIPWPKSIEVKQGQMKLTAGSRIVASDDSLRGLADILAAEINLLTGLKLTVAGDAARTGDIVLKINQAIKADDQILVVRPPSVVRTTDARAVGRPGCVGQAHYQGLAPRGLLRDDD